MRIFRSRVLERVLLVPRRAVHGAEQRGVVVLVDEPVPQEGHCSAGEPGLRLAGPPPPRIGESGSRRRRRTVVPVNVPVVAEELIACGKGTARGQGSTPARASFGRGHVQPPGRTRGFAGQHTPFLTSAAASSVM